MKLKFSYSARKKKNQSLQVKNFVSLDAGRCYILA